MGGILHLLRVYSMLLCMTCHTMMGMGNQLWDRMTMAGVVGDDWVTCTGTDDMTHWGNEIHR